MEEAPPELSADSAAVAIAAIEAEKEIAIAEIHAEVETANIEMRAAEYEAMRESSEDNDKWQILAFQVEQLAATVETLSSLVETLATSAQPTYSEQSLIPLSTPEPISSTQTEASERNEEGAPVVELLPELPPVVETEAKPRFLLV